MENIDTRATAFGRVLGALMEARGIPAGPEAMRALFDRSGLDGEKLLAHAGGEHVPDLGSLTGLDREMGLSDEEVQALAMAYVYEQDDIGDLIRRGDTFNDACTLVLDTTGRGSTRRTESASSTSWAPNGTRRGRRRSGSRRRSGRRNGRAGIR